MVQPSIAVTLSHFFVRSNSWFTWAPTQSQTMTVTLDAAVDAGGGISADGKGSGPGLGTGAGRSLLATNVYTGGGAGYGGVGAPSAYGAAGGIAYGTMDQPNSLGSGGGNGNPQGAPGGAGGGFARLIVNGALTLNGRLSADGLPGKGPGSGGGSGGSVWLTAGTIAGAGTVSANGGGGELPLGGGAGGGRVAIYYSTNQFSGSVAAHGGLGATNGGAGTILWQGPTNTAAQVIVDNAGVAGTSNTVVLVRSSGYNLTVTGRAVAAQATGVVLGNLLIGSNSWLTATPNPEVPLVLRVTNNATIQGGGGIVFDGLGECWRERHGAGPNDGHTGRRRRVRRVRWGKCVKCCPRRDYLRGGVSTECKRERWRSWQRRCALQCGRRGWGGRSS